MPPMPPPGMPPPADFLLRGFGDRGFRRDDEAGDRGCVLQRRAHDLHRIDDAGLHEVDVLFGLRVEAEIVVLVLAQLADNDRAFNAGVFHDLTDRGFQRLLDDADADVLVFVVALDVELERSPGEPCRRRGRCLLPPQRGWRSARHQRGPCVPSLRLPSRHRP
jgi:hypothetical protein